MADPDSPRVLVIVGATGVGKTSTACHVAPEIGGEIVSADSRQIYRGLDIGTAKPAREEMEAVRHHLIDVADPRDYFDAGRFCEEARKLFGSIAARGGVPMLVGGTGLYIRAALEGLFPGPKRDAALRESLRALEREEPGCLHRRLAVVDPVKAKRLSPRDLARVLRALEVYELTGTPMSDAQAAWVPEPHPHVAVGLALPREEIYRRIDSRVLEMVRRGLFEEVEGILASGVDADAPGLRTIGYREIVACLKGDISRDEAVRLIQRNTRRYAKRQITWFRRMSIRRWISVDDQSWAAREVLSEWQSGGS